MTNKLLIFLCLWTIGVTKSSFSQSYNLNIVYPNVNTFGGQICLYNNKAHIFYSVDDTSDISVFAAASINGTVSENGNVNFNSPFRPDSLAWFIAPNYYCKSHTLSDGFISSGLGNSYTNRNKALLVVYDTNGIMKFYSAFDHYGAGSFDAIRTKKNQYMLAGRVIEFSEGLPMFILTDSLGNEISYKFYDGAYLRYYDDVYARSIIELDSGNALLVCDAYKEMFSSPSDRWKVPVKTILIKVDSVGNELWRWIDPSDNAKAAFSFQKTSDGGYISCGLNIGYRDSVNWDYTHQPCIIKWRNDFSIEWKKWYDDYRKDSVGGELFDIKELSDGSFITCGYGGETKTELIKGGIILKIDRYGNLLWRKYYSAFPDSSDNPNIDNFLYDIDVFDNGDIIAVGETRPTWGIGQRTWILRTDSNGCIVDSNWCGWNSIEVEPTPNVWHNTNELLVYPNPVNDKINLIFKNSSLNFSDKLNVRIFDIQGREVYHQINNYKDLLHIDINDFERGIYFIKINTEDNKVVSNGKFVKE